MLTITLVSVSHKQPAWVTQAFDEYAKRLPAREIKLECKELKPEAREGKSIAQAMSLEAAKIQAAIPKGALVLALDERGQDLTSMALAQKLQHWQAEHSQVVFIIGGADGPMAIYTTMKLAPHLLPQISVAAYSYMALMPLIQPPVMRFLTTKEERQIIMKQPRYVSRLEKIVFPVVIAIIVNLFLPPVAPLITMLMLGNLLRECLCVDRLAETASNALLNIVTLVLTVAIGSTMAADTFLTPNTLLIIALGLVAFIFGTGSGVVCARIMNKISGGRINPLIGSAGIASVPIAARVSHLVGQQENRQNFLIMHAMGPNLAGVFGTAISGGIMLALLVK